MGYTTCGQNEKPSHNDKEAWCEYTHQDFQSPSLNFNALGSQELLS